MIVWVMEFYIFCVGCGWEKREGLRRDTDLQGQGHLDFTCHKKKKLEFSSGVILD